MSVSVSPVEQWRVALALASAVRFGQADLLKEVRAGKPLSEVWADDRSWRLVVTRLLAAQWKWALPSADLAVQRAGLLLDKAFYEGTRVEDLTRSQCLALELVVPGIHRPWDAQVDVLLFELEGSR